MLCVALKYLEFAQNRCSRVLSIWSCMKCEVPVSIYDDYKVVLSLDKCAIIDC